MCEGDLVQLPCSNRVPRALSTVAFGYLQVWKLHNLYGCLVPVTLPVKRCSLIVRGSLLCSGLCPLPLVLLLGKGGEEPVFIFTPFLQVFVHID